MPTILLIATTAPSQTSQVVGILAAAGIVPFVLTHAWASHR